MWKKDLTKDHIGSGVIAAGHFYSVAENGIAICLDATTGERKWQKRLRGKGHNGGSWSSIVLADGKLLIANQSGEVFVLEASPKFQLLSTNSVLDETNCASLAISDGLVLLRTHDSLWCFGR